MGDQTDRMRQITLTEANYLINPLRSAIVGLTSGLMDVASALMIHGGDDDTKLKATRAFERMNDVIQALDSFQERLDQLSGDAKNGDE